MPKISQQMTLKQQLSPQQVLQASLLQLNLPLLEQRILHELEINPALELIDVDDVDELELQELDTAIEDAEEESEEPDKSDEEMSNTEEEIEFDWEELLGVNDDYEYPKSQEKKDEEFETPLIARETFSERIMQQLQDYDMSVKDLEISEHVLGDLDAVGRKRYTEGYV